MEDEEIPRERARGLYRLLRLPRAYALVTGALGTNRVQEYLTDQVLPDTTGLSVLDFGAGTGAIRPHLASHQYTAIEPNPRYCQAIKRRIGGGDSVLCGSVEELEGLSGTYDVILMLAVLHHLDDALGARVLRGFASRLHPDGVAVVMDNVFFPGQSMVSRLLAAADRGQHVRSVRAYQELAAPSFSQVTSVVTRGLMRVPYDHHWMLCRSPRGRG